MGKITIIEGNSNDKDNIRLYMTKGEKGDKGDKGQDGTGTKLSDLENDMDFQTEADVNSLIEAKMLTMYPIGSIYFTANNINPSTFLGGYWEQIAEGQFIVGVGTGTDQNEVEKTFIAGENAGEYEHSLTKNELPNFGGRITMHNGATATTISHVTGDFTETQTCPSYYPQGQGIQGATSVGVVDLSVGEDDAHNITGPSFGLYCWQRVNPPEEE